MRKCGWSFGPHRIITRENYVDVIIKRDNFRALCKLTPLEIPMKTLQFDQTTTGKNRHIRSAARTHSSFELEAQVRVSLNKMLALLNPVLEDSAYDDAMIELAFSKDCFVEPLSQNEVSVLAVALYCDRSGVHFGYSDVLSLTARFHGTEMNTATVYRTVMSLVNRGFLSTVGRVKNKYSGRPENVHTITENGKVAFRSALSNIYALATRGGKKAA